MELPLLCFLPLACRFFAFRLRWRAPALQGKSRFPWEFLNWPVIPLRHAPGIFHGRIGGEGAIAPFRPIEIDRNQQRAESMRWAMRQRSLPRARGPASEKTAQRKWKSDKQAAARPGIERGRWQT